MAGATFCHRPPCIFHSQSMCTPKQVTTVYEQQLEWGWLVSRWSGQIAQRQVCGHTHTALPMIAICKCHWPGLLIHLPGSLGASLAAVSSLIGDPPTPHQLGKVEGSPAFHQSLSAAPAGGYTLCIESGPPLLLASTSKVVFDKTFRFLTCSLQEDKGSTSIFTQGRR